MAVPQELAMPNLTGKYSMNKQLSDNVDPLFVLQGLSWFLRTTIKMATVTMRLKQYTKDGVDHMDLGSSVSGLPETVETRVLDFELRPRKDKVFGDVRGKSKVVKLEDYTLVIEGGTEKDLEFLKAGAVDPVAIQGYAESTGSVDWRVEQVWGIEEIAGERRLTQKAVARKGKQVIRVKIVYDHLGTVDS